MGQASVLKIGLLGGVGVAVGIGAWLWLRAHAPEVRPGFGSPGQGALGGGEASGPSAPAKDRWSPIGFEQAARRAVEAPGSVGLSNGGGQLALDAKALLNALVEGDLDAYRNQFAAAGQPAGAWADGDPRGREMFRRAAQGFAAAEWDFAGVRVTRRDVRRGIMPGGQAPVGTQSATILATGVSPEKPLPAWASPTGAELVIPAVFQTESGTRYEAQVVLVMSWNPATRRWTLLSTAIRGLPPGVRATLPPS